MYYVSNKIKIFKQINVVGTGKVSCFGRTGRK